MAAEVAREEQNRGSGESRGARGFTVQGLLGGFRGLGV